MKSSIVQKRAIIQKKALKVATSSYLFVLGSLLFGCAVDDFSIQLLGVNALNNECKPSTDATSYLLSKGSVDLTVAEDYSIYIATKNLLYNTNQVNALSEKDARVSSTDININEVEVEYVDINEIGLGFDSKRNIPTSALIKAGSNDITRLGVELLTEEMLDNLRANGAFQGISASGALEGLKGSIYIDVKMALKGKTLDGRDVKSNEITFPIEVCTGCRISFNQVVTKPNGSQICPAPEGDLDALVDDNQKACLSYLGRDDKYVSCGLCQLLLIDEGFSNLCQPE
jgi:hypothetical protein